MMLLLNSAAGRRRCDHAHPQLGSADTQVAVARTLAINRRVARPLILCFNPFRKSAPSSRYLSPCKIHPMKQPPDLKQRGKFNARFLGQPRQCGKRIQSIECNIANVIAMRKLASPLPSRVQLFDQCLTSCNLLKLTSRTVVFLQRIGSGVILHVCLAHSRCRTELGLPGDKSRCDSIRGGNGRSRKEQFDVGGKAIKVVDAGGADESFFVLAKVSYQSK